MLVAYFWPLKPIVKQSYTKCLLLTRNVYRGSWLAWEKRSRGRGREASGPFIGTTLSGHTTLPSQAVQLFCSIRQWSQWPTSHLLQQWNVYIWTNSTIPVYTLIYSIVYLHLWHCIPSSLSLHTLNYNIVYLHLWCCIPSSITLYTLIYSIVHLHLWHCKPSS